MEARWENHLLDLAGDLPHPITRPIFMRTALNPELQRAYHLCDQVTAEHSKSFYLASGLLPGNKRPAVRALYAFCRIVDDIVDESEAEDRCDRLSSWKQVVQMSMPLDDDPIAAAWTDTLTRYAIPRHFALQLIDGVARDLTTTRYQTFADLTTYCYGVASTVGLMSMYIVGFLSKNAIPYAIKLGIALQMTNILRDIHEDYSRGFIYLPQDELDAFGIRQADLEAGVVTPAWRDFMRFQINRTRSLYNEAHAGIAQLSQDGRLAIAAASNLYNWILDDIEAHDYDVFSRRAHLSTWGKIKRIPALWWSLQSN